MCPQLLNRFQEPQGRAAVAAALLRHLHDTSDHSTEMRSPATLPVTSNRKLPEGSKKPKVKEPLWVLPPLPRVRVSLRWMVPMKFPFVSYDHTR